jgi:hypothetical protein
MKLSVNLISKKKYFEAGTEVPDKYVPVWAIRKYRIGDIEAAAIRQRRAELQAEARLRRERKEEAKRGAVKQSA